MLLRSSGKDYNKLQYDDFCGVRNLCLKATLQFLVYKMDTSCLSRDFNKCKLNLQCCDTACG